MRKAFLIFCLLLAVSVYGIAQTALQNKVDPKEYKPYPVKIKGSSIKNETPYFFKVLDKRPDTTRLGYMKDGDQQIYFHLKEPASSYLFARLNESKTVYKDTLYILLHKLWVFESFLPRKQFALLNSRDYSIKCFGRIAADVYHKNADGMGLVASYDSSVSTSGYMANNVDYPIAKGLNIFIRQADSSAASRRAATAEWKKSQEPSVPAILQTDRYKDGIYLSYENFLNNDPLDIGFDYKAKKRKESLVLVQQQPGDSIYTEYNWGFCKDGVIYMHIGPSYSKLTKIENSFELRAVDIARFYQYEGLKKGAVAVAGVDLALFRSPAFLLMDLAAIFLPSKTDQYENISAFKLDLQTGDVY